MKQVSIMLTAMLLLSFGFFSADAQNAWKGKFVSNPASCCPDTSSLISTEVAGYANADLLIEKPSIYKDPVTGNYTFTAVVANPLGDDCAACSKIIVLLPAEVNVISYSAVSLDLPRKFKVSRCFGTLLIDTDTICKTGNLENVRRIRVTVKTSNHTSKINWASFAIMAYSKVPDTNLKNNYWSGRK